MVIERQQIDRAVERYEEGKAGLFREDGSEKEHAERERLLAEEFRATLDDIEEALGRKISTARATLLQHTQDRSTGLSAGEPTDNRYSSVERDAESLSLEQLAGRCEAALSDKGGDVAAVRLLSRYARERATRERSADERVTHTDGYVRLEVAISRLEESLKPPEVKEAEQTIERARKIKRYLSLRRDRAFRT
ncbi:MAG TPA: hypothetical protein VK869_05865 [Rubrobacteraceae bacterium]|nr:hypothetical protein [Rubrobacteraceae bacterium]